MEYLTPEVKKECNDIIVTAGKIKITNDEENKKATEFMKAVKKLSKMVKESFQPHIQKAHSLWKGLITEQNKHLKPLEEAERLVKQKVAEYYKIIEEQRKEEERKALEKARKEEEKRKKQLEKKIAKAEAEGDDWTAEALKEEKETVFVAPTPVNIEKPKEEGVTVLFDWDFEIEDEAKIPREFLRPDEQKIRKYVKAMKEQARIPGVRIFKKERVRVRV